MKFNKYLLCFALIFIFIFLISSLTFAYTPNFQIKPSRFELLLGPRERTIETINIINEGEKKINFSLKSRDWQLTKTGDIDLMEPSALPRSASNWLRFNPKNIEISPGESQVVRFSIAVPPKVESGEYRTAILLSTEKKFAEDLKINIKPQFAILVYVNIPDIKRYGKIKNIEVKANEYGEYKLGGKVDSLGNAHLRITGSYVLKNKEDEIIKEKELKKMVIPAGGSEKFGDNMGFLSPGKYNLKIDWFYIPALYMDGNYDEFPDGKNLMSREYEFVIEE